MTVPEVYFWDGWQTVEEYTNTGSWAVNKQYVWGEGIDECLKVSLPDKASDLDNDSVTNEKVDLYYHHNSLGSVVAVTNAVGKVVESYRYSAFGKPTIYGEHPSEAQGQGSEIAATYVEQPFMFTGARYDFEEGSGLYQMRMRYYDPVVGRFVSRDPLGLWGDPSQNGNGQGYCGHDPANRSDPMGLGDPIGGPVGNLPPDKEGRDKRAETELQDPTLKPALDILGDPAVSIAARFARPCRCSSREEVQFDWAGRDRTSAQRRSVTPGAVGNPVSSVTSSACSATALARIIRSISPAVSPAARRCAHRLAAASADSSSKSSTKANARRNCSKRSRRRSEFEWIRPRRIS